MPKDYGRVPEIAVGSEIISMCIKKPCDIDELVRKIYIKYDMYAKGKIYTAVEVLCKQGILTPMGSKDRRLLYKYNKDLIKE